MGTLPTLGGRWGSALLAALLTAAVVGVSAASSSGEAASPSPGGAPLAKQAQKCKRAIVSGRRICLRTGDRCNKAFQDDYLAAGFSCKRGKLRKATLAELRDGQPLLLEKNGQLSLETALAAFDATIADLPGVEARKGEIGKLTDATMVVEELGTSIDQLSAKQRQVYERWTTPAPDAVLSDEPPAPRAPAGRRAPPTPQEVILADAYLDDALRVLRNHGYFPAHRVSLTLLDNQGTTKPNVVAYVSPADVPPGTSPTCNMFLTKKGRSQSAIDVRFTIAHEAAHCAQHAFYASQADQKRVPGWVKEGTAEWLGAKVTEELGVGAPSEVDWTAWLKDPANDLFTRSYDAIGFYAMLEQAGIDTWGRIKSVISAAAAGGSPPAFAAAIAGAPEIFYSRWGPGLARDPALGPEWDYSGPFIDPSRLKKVPIRDGTRRASTIQARGSAAAQLEIKADVVTIAADKATRGLLRFEGELRKLQKGAYCAKQGGCKCKTRTNLQIPKIGATTYFGFSDPAKSRTVTFQGRSLKDYCKKPRPGPAPCTARAAAARRGAASCPVPAPGIQVFQGTEPGNEQLVATFRIGDCTAGAGFTAISTDGAWRLEVGIQNFAGFGQTYNIPYGGPDPEVIIEGPGGTYSNTTWAPPGLPIAGAIDFDESGARMGLGFIEFRTADESSAIVGAGGMTCVYPDD
jgi:hypothetical protein